MFDWLTYDGYLILRGWPDLSPHTITALNRIGKLGQFFSAFVIVVQLAGADRINHLTTVFTWPLSLLINFFARLLGQEKRSKTPEERAGFTISFASALVWSLPFYTVVWWPWWWLSGQPLPRFVFSGFDQFRKIPSAFADFSLSWWWLLIGVPIAVGEALWYYSLGGVLLGFRLIYPIVGAIVIIGKVAEVVTKKRIAETLFQLFFFVVFVVGFILDFITAK